jgi:glycosyltransferase involved in cell wall biosynthesis
MRILHVISGLDPQNGGPTTALTGMAKSQAAAGLDVSVLATWKETTGFPVAEHLRQAGVNVTHIGPATGRFSRHPQLAAATRTQVARADVVHIHAMWEEVQYQAARAARTAGVPYLFTPHGMLDPFNMSKGKLLKHLYLALRLRRNLDQAAALHLATTMERDAVARLGLRPPTIVEPFGLDLAEFQTLPPPGVFRSRYPALGGKPYVLFLGRIHPGKGLELLVPAFAAANLPEAMLVIAGPDSDSFRQQVEATVTACGLRDRTLFTGMLTGIDRIAALAEAELLALPSFHENFGLAVAESLAAGTPVIVSDQVYLYREIVSQGVGAAVPLEVAPLAAKLKRWMTDKSLRQAASERARPFVQERFDWRQIAQHWVEHYARLASSRQ